MKKVRGLLVLIGAIALVLVGFLFAKLLNSDSQPKVSATSIEERLSTCSSLTTARLDYRGMIKYSDGDITFINKKSFSMIYDAHITAGIDLAKAKVDIHDSQIMITLPAAEIQDIMVDSDTIEFYDEKFALFNWTDKSDTAKALDYAREDATKKATQTEILEQANEQAQTAITALLTPLTQEKDTPYQITFAKEQVSK